MPYESFEAKTHSTRYSLVPCASGELSRGKPPPAHYEEGRVAA